MKTAKFVLVLTMWFEHGDQNSPVQRLRLEGFSSEAACMHAGAAFLQTPDPLEDLRAVWLCPRDEHADRLYRASR